MHFFLRLMLHLIGWGAFALGLAAVLMALSASMGPNRFTHNPSAGQVLIFGISAIASGLLLVTVAELLALAREIATELQKLNSRH